MRATLRRRIGERDRRGCGSEAQTLTRLAADVERLGPRVKRSASAQRRPRASACSRRASRSCGRATTSTSIARRSRSVRLPGDDCALTVLARVVSRPAADRIILDCGSKTLSNDQARGFVDCPGFGVVLRRPRHAAARTNRCSSNGCRKSTRPCASSDPECRLQAWRSRACAAQPLVRRVESRRLGMAGERGRGPRRAAGCRARPDRVAPPTTRTTQTGRLR